MQLESGIAHLRPRSAYEAVDFGFHFVRAYYFRLVAIAALLIVPLSTLLALIFRGQTLWILLLIWWTKPLWERALLFFVSRALFDDVPSVRETVRAFPEYGFKDAFAALTFRRLSPTRSFDLPVTVLEGSTGSERGARLGILHRGRFPSAAIVLTLLLAHIEIGLLIGLMILLQVLVPEGLDWDVFEWAFALTSEPTLSGEFFVYALELVSMLLIAPYYVVAGFSLYLHRRTELEAWDLELAFRRLAERRQAQRPMTPSRGGSAAGAIGNLAVTVALCLPLSFAASGSLPSSAVGAEEMTPKAARESIEGILAREAFHQKETVSIPQFILDIELNPDDESDTDFPEWLTHFFDWLASVLGGGFEILIISAALGLVAWLLYRIASSQGLLEGASVKTRGRRGVPTVLFGLEVTEESLPDDLVGEALANARAGKSREALALLYRGALTRLARGYGADLPVGVTERECLEAARPLLPVEGGEYFDQLTGVWLRCAYGHIDPDPQRLESLCQRWSAWFEKQDQNGVDSLSVAGDSA